jgi:hypothetical protein
LGSILFDAGSHRDAARKGGAFVTGLAIVSNAAKCGRALRLLAVLREDALPSYNSDSIQVLLLRANNLCFRAKTL